MAHPSEMLPVLLVNVLSIAHTTDQLAPQKMTKDDSAIKSVTSGLPKAFHQ